MSITQTMYTPSSSVEDFTSVLEKWKRLDGTQYNVRRNQIQPIANPAKANTILLQFLNPSPSRESTVENSSHEEGMSIQPMNQSNTGLPEISAQGQVGPMQIFLHKQVANVVHTILEETQTYFFSDSKSEENTISTLEYKSAIRTAVIQAATKFPHHWDSAAYLDALMGTETKLTTEAPRAFNIFLYDIIVRLADGIALEIVRKHESTEDGHKAFNDLFEADNNNSTTKASNAYYSCYTTRLYMDKETIPAQITQLFEKIKDYETFQPQALDKAEIWRIVRLATSGFEWTPFHTFAQSQKEYVQEDLIWIIKQIGEFTKSFHGVAVQDILNTHVQDIICSHSLTSLFPFRQPDYTRKSVHSHKRKAETSEKGITSDRSKIPSTQHRKNLQQISDISTHQSSLFWNNCQPSQHAASGGYQFDKGILTGLSNEHHHQSNTMCVDSGASHHIVNSLENFKTIDPNIPPKEFTVVHGEAVMSHTAGSIILLVRTAEGHTRELQLNNVYYIPDQQFNLISVYRGVQHNNFESPDFRGLKWKATEDCTMLLNLSAGGTYTMDAQIKQWSWTRSGVHPQF